MRSSSSSHVPRVLVIDDNDITRAFIIKTLQRLGYKVIAAKNGMEAHGIIVSDRVPYDLIVTEVSMPFMDGVEFAKFLRSMGDATPIVFMAYKNSTRSYRPEELASISPHFLSKPFVSTKHLEDTIRGALEGHHAHR